MKSYATIDDLIIEDSSVVVVSQETERNLYEHMEEFSKKVEREQSEAEITARNIILD